MKVATSLLVALPVLGGISALTAAQDFSRIEFTTSHLRGSVHMLRSRAGGNLAACVGPDGVFLIDADYEQMSEKTIDAAVELCDGPLRFVFNTHWHFDHTGGNEALADSGAEIIAHENVRKRMVAGQLITVIDADVPPAPARALPTITFTDTLDLNLNGEEIHVFHPGPAHTDGDGIVCFKKANVIHVGDLVFNGGYPFIDVSSGGNVDGVIRALEAVLALSDDDTRIVPGHGELSDKAELNDYVDMLRAFRELIALEIADGKDLETIVAERPTAAIDEDWGRGHFSPAIFTEIVYRSLVGAAADGEAGRGGG